MNEKVLRHKEICDGLNELYARKNHDYGDSFHTTYQAMMNLEIEELRFKKLLRSIKDVCDLADFEIEGRVVLIDKRSGRVWR